MIRLGVIGTGGMANAHGDGFSKIKGVKLTACCDIDRARAEAFAAKWGIPQVFTDYGNMLREAPLDAVTNVTIDSVHAAASLAAIGRGLHVLCEKPLATSLADARKMAAAAKKAGVINMVNFSYRNSAGLQAAAKVVAAGTLGGIKHVESSYLQCWLATPSFGDWRTNKGLTWRLSTRHGSAGVLGDLGCHIYDLTAMLAGDIAEINCRLETFDKGLPGNRLGEYVLDANDSFVSTVAFANGAIGTVHSSRWAVGHINSLRCRVYGEDAAIELDLDSNWNGYRICRADKKKRGADWKAVQCKPTPTNFQRFVKSIQTGKNDPNDFANGTKVQAYLHASFESDKLGRTVKVKA